MTVRQAIGRALLGAAAVSAPVGAVRFDWNETHVFNPAWPPHAKFHNAQTISLGVALAGATLLALRPSVGSPAPAAGLASLYWVTQLASLTFPGTALQDPGQPAPPRIAGRVPFDQRGVALLHLAAIGVGSLLARRG